MTARCHAYTKSCAVTAQSLDQRAFSRKWKVQTFWSALTDQDSAIAGAACPVLSGWVNQSVMRQSLRKKYVDCLMRSIDCTLVSICISKIPSPSFLSGFVWQPVSKMQQRGIHSKKEIIPVNGLHRKPSPYGEKFFGKEEGHVSSCPSLGCIYVEESESLGCFLESRVCGIHRYQQACAFAPIPCRHLHGRMHRTARKQGSRAGIPSRTKNRPPPIDTEMMTHRLLKPVERPRILGTMILPSTCCKTRMKMINSRHWMGFTRKIRIQLGMAPIKGRKEGNQIGDTDQYTQKGRIGDM